MKNKKTIFIATISLLLFYAGYLVSTPTMESPPDSKYYLSIKKIGNVWKVVDSNNKTKVRVEKGAKITWTAEGSDVVFQFPSQIYLKPQGKEDSLSKNNTKKIKSGKKLKLKITEDALQDTIVYAVFVLKDGVYAEGGSPPRIIIR
jgi:hypothetical protein